MAEATPVQRVVIVGGGTSGWLTATFIAKTIARTRPISITLVESPDIGIIGVGEATVPTLVRTLGDLGIEEDDFLRSVNGAFKQAIRFQDWAADPAMRPSWFYHPFFQTTPEDVLAAAEYIRAHPSLGVENFARLVTPQGMACDLFKAPGPLSGASGGDVSYAYHMDATLFGRFLRKKVEGQGVERVEGEVGGVVRAENGDIATLQLKDGRRIDGDLFVDCSGFRGLLINEHLGVEFRSFSHWLPCDKALAISVPYLPGERIAPFTKATARGAGWIWDINLASRRGVGHVYSSEYWTRAQAEASLRDYLGRSWPQQADVREISIRVGRNESLWERNCVAIGLAGGFIEPLESTGIYLVEQGARYLLDHWPVGGITPHHRWGYNELMHRLYREVLEFVFMHYVTSQRRDTVFWQDFPARMDTMPEAFRHRLQLWRHKYPSNFDVKLMDGRVFGLDSWMNVLMGMGWLRDSASPFSTGDPLLGRKRWEMKVKGFDVRVRSLPDHEVYLEHHGVSVCAEVRR